MRKSIRWIAFAFLVFSPMAVWATEYCHWGIVEDYSVISDGYEWRHIEYGWICQTYDDGPPGGGNPGGGGGSQPFPPSVNIVSVSDENPHQVTLQFQYTGSPTEMFLRKNGELISSGSPASYGFFGSLDDMIFDSVLTVTMCNAGGCADAAADVRRRTVRQREEGAVSAEWADYVPIDPYNITIVFGSESYTRMLEVEVFLAEYSVATSGARNGRARHVQSADALLWENGKRAPQWETTYRLIPSWSWSESPRPLGKQGDVVYRRVDFRTRAPNAQPLASSHAMGHLAVA